ncbi:MAG: HD domain-containing protein [Oribacterium sp.]|nr:HD domain-containing protein [Oribacterium sp.]
MKRRNITKHVAIKFGLTLAIAIVILLISIIKTHSYNALKHETGFSGAELFSRDNAQHRAVNVTASTRGSTWSKAFDLNNEGITEHNFQAYTVDYTITNGTGDQVADYSLRLNFTSQAFLQSAWNGSLEFHQQSDKGEVVDTVYDLREFVPEEHNLEIFTVDGDNLVVMDPGDYLIYHPSTAINAVEMPIDPYKATTPGIIMYIRIGENLDEAMSVDFEYSFHRRLYKEPLFWVSQGFAAIWLISVLIYIITSMQIKKYKVQHERDNKIINESIETFIGFIDAKDSYTNGHSIRVARYTRAIAEEMGCSEEELERIYYVALLHDCGKIGVPDSILGKPDRLTDEEFQVIKSHTERGGAILRHFKSLKNVEEGALYHHERYDGRGYPEGLAGEDIPLIARIICVVDSYDAMNSDRVYRNKLSKERIIEEIENGKGKQFDPEIADIMLRLIKNNKLDADD